MKIYNVDRLVHFESFSSFEEAMAREMQIKKYRKEKKDRLVQCVNPEWADLYNTL